jgi:MFS family permease
MFGWYRDCSRDEKRTFAASVGGYGLDSFDTMAFSFAIPALIAVWGMSKSDAGLMGSVALVMSAIGGWGAGILADRWGRVRTLKIVVIWFTIFTLASGLTSSPTQLLVTRGLQGLGFGGEWSVGSLLVAETMQSKHRGKTVGLVQASWAVGWALVAMVYTLVFSLASEQWAWRILFLAAIIPAIPVYLLFAGVKEPEIYRRTKASQQQTGEKSNFLDIFRLDVLATTFFACLLCTGAQGGYYAVTTWLPTFLKTTRGLSVLNTGGYLGVVIAGSLTGYIVSAYLCDLIGRRLNFVIYALGSGSTLLVYTLLPIADSQMMLLGFPLGFFASGIFSGMGSFLAELFPSHIRGSAQGFTYNFGRGVGALAPFLVGFLGNSYGLGVAIAIFAGSSYCLIFIAVLFLPETKGRDLIESIHHAADQGIATPEVEHQ